MQKWYFFSPEDLFEHVQQNKPELWRAFMDMQWQNVEPLLDPQPIYTSEYSRDLIVMEQSNLWLMKVLTDYIEAKDFKYFNHLFMENEEI